MHCFLCQHGPSARVPCCLRYLVNGPSSGQANGWCVPTLKGRDPSAEYGPLKHRIIATRDSAYDLRDFVDKQDEKIDVLVNVENAVPPDMEPRDGNVDAADGRGSTAVCTGDQTGVTSSSPASPARVYCQAQADVNVAAYVPLPQLIDHISPYTAVDTA